MFEDSRCDNSYDYSWKNIVVKSNMLQDYHFLKSRQFKKLQWFRRLYAWILVLRRELKQVLKDVFYFLPRITTCHTKTSDTFSPLKDGMMASKENLAWVCVRHPLNNVSCIWYFNWTMVIIIYKLHNSKFSKEAIMVKWASDRVASSHLGRVNM